MRFTKDEVIHVGPMLDGLRSIGEGHVFEPPKVQVWKDGLRVGMVHWVDTDTKTMFREDPEHIWLDEDCTVRTPEPDRKYITDTYDSLTVLFHLAPEP